MFYLTLPAVFLKFWFFEAPKTIIIFFSSLNNSALTLLSLPILVKTYFRPWKNEYREGLVRFSIVMGIFVKTFIIVADLILFITLLFIELILFFSFIFWPIATVILLFA